MSMRHTPEEYAMVKLKLAKFKKQYPPIFKEDETDPGPGKGDNMRELHLEIPGKPIAKKRPRFYRRGDFVGTYKDQETEEGRWIWEARNQITPEIKKHLPLTGPIILRVRFLMPVPGGWPKYRIEMLKRGIQIPHVKRPDLDNLIKWVKDCCNGWLWKDDSQVWKMTDPYKIYGLRPATLIEIIEEKGG